MFTLIGLDIGSSSCKSCLLQTASSPETETTPLSSYSIISSSVVNYELLRLKGDPNHWEIPIRVILKAIKQSIKDLKIEDGQNGRFNQIDAIAVSGQMHGCVLWSNQPKPWIYDQSEKDYLMTEDLLSNLYSWQDQRCNKQFIDSLPKCKSPLATGFGLATILWLSRHQPTYLSKFNHTGTIMDLIVSMICNLEKPVMSHQNAAGFGYFSFRKNSWSKKLSEWGDPTIGKLLPELVDVGRIAGSLAADWLGLPKGIPVFTAFGDLQCSTFACIRNEPNSAVLTMSTSLQLVVNPNDQSWFNQEKGTSEMEPDLSKVSLVPYVDGRFIAGAASLNGGNVLEAFVDFLHNWLKDLVGPEFPRSKIWEQLNETPATIDESGHSHGQAINNTENLSSIRFIATLFGERYDPQLRSSLINIPIDLTPNKLFLAVCQGLIDNVFTMIPIQWLTRLPINSIKATGGALLRNKALRQALEKVCRPTGIQVEYMKATADAHVGAALMAAMFLSRKQQQ